MNRREFLKTAAAASAALIPASLDAGNPVPSEDSAMASHFPGISLLGYGCMRWPMKEDEDGKEIIDQEAVNRLVDKALSSGVNYFDTAPVYLRGESEKATSIALNRYPRSRWLLATKSSNFSDSSYSNSVKIYRRSLEIFNTDHIDYYLLHSVSGAAAFKKRYEDSGFMKFLVSEREKGNIRNLGFSFHGPVSGLDELLELHSKYHWDFIQIQMNYLDWRGKDNAEYQYDRISSLGIPVIVMEPLLGGSLADLPAGVAARLKSACPSASLASWAFRFAGSFPGVMTVLSGMTYMDHLEDNLSTYCSFKPLTDKEMALLQSIADEMLRFPLVPCTGCQYCEPCPYGIDIPGIFSFYNHSVTEETYVTSTEQKDYARARRRYLASYDASVEKARQADHCIICGKCVPLCPQRIAIPKELRRIDTYIESLKRGI